MIRIFESPYLVLLILVEIVAAITGIFCLKKYRSSKMRYFIYFLICIAFFSCLMTYTYSVRFNGVLSFLETTKIRVNYWLSTLYWNIGAMLFYSCFFCQFIKKKSYVKLIRWLSIAFLLFAIIIIIAQFDKFFISQYVSLRIAGNLLLIISISLYFIEVLQSDKLLMFYKSNIFYIASIVFIWLLVTMPLSFYNHYHNLQDPVYVELRSAIYFYVNFFMYIGFTIILLFGKPEKVIND